MIDTLGEVIAAHGEGLGGIYVHAAQSVHDLGETGEVHPHIEGRVGAVEIVQGLHGLAGAVDSGVGQLVQLAVVSQGQVIVPGVFTNRICRVVGFTTARMFTSLRLVMLMLLLRASMPLQ